MLVHVNTDNHIRGSDELIGSVEGRLTQAFARFEPQLMRIEVRLSDENSQKGGNDKRCLLEARFSGQEPLVASENSPNLEQAVEGAVDKLLRVIESQVERLEDSSRRVSMSGEPGSGTQEIR